MCTKAIKNNFVFPFFYSLVKFYWSKAQYEENKIESINKFIKLLKLIEEKKVFFFHMYIFV